MPTKKYKPVGDFYAGRSVFLTGVSGFLGKVILEKLLYSCKDVQRVYVLIRGKKGTSADQRFHDIVDRPLFTRLKEERPQDLDKIVPVVGDLILPNLGIEEAVEDSFIDKVSVVIHSAAAIQNNQRLDDALNINLEGTRRILNLCRRMPNISSFVHISTAYANMERKEIDEVIYPAPADLDDVYASIKQHGVTDDKIINKIMNGKLTPYIFTKAMTENMLLEHHGDIPTTIIRPTTVSASIKEPMPGWVDNWFAATGIIQATESGINRVLYGKKSNILDMIPVDYVSNLAIVAAAKNKPGKDISVYNCSSFNNPITLRQLHKDCKAFYVSNKYYDIYPSLLFTKNKFVLKFATFFLQMLPAKMADIYLRAKGEKPRYAKLQSKLTGFRDAQAHYSGGSWIVKSERSRSLFSSLSPEDKHKFPFDATLIDWKKYLPTYCRGIRRYMLKK